jgi:hypothetical protein
VTHGPEYSVVRRNVDVDAGRGAVLSVILVHEVDTTGWIAGDFHLHSAPSMDSEVSLVDRVTSLASAGVEYAVATDHNEVTDFGPAIRALRLEGTVGSAIGVEITTAEWGHFNAYPLDDDNEAPPYAGVAPTAIFEAVHTGHPTALVQINHPWMPGYGYFHRATLDEATGRVVKKGFSFDFEAVEVINGFELGTAGALDANLRRWFSLLGSGKRYAAVGNSDSHRVAREWACYPRTYIQVRDDRPMFVTPQEIAESIRQGRTVVSNGIFATATVNSVGPGGTLHVAPGEVEVGVEVRAADWIDVKQAEVVLHGEDVDVLPMSAPWRGDVRLQRSTRIDVARSGFLMVVVRGERSLDSLLPGMQATPFCFTGPIYIELTGQARPPPPEPAVVSQLDAAPVQVPIEVPGRVPSEELPEGGASSEGGPGDAAAD